MAPYRNTGHTSGYEPYDMNQQPLTPRPTASNEPTISDDLRECQRTTRASMEETPASATLPPGPQRSALELVEKEMYSLLENMNDAAAYALANGETHPEQALKRLQDASAKTEEFKRILLQAQERQLQGLPIEDKDTYDDDPIAPSAMRKLQEVVRGMRIDALPESSDPDRQAVMLNLRDEMNSVCDSLDAAAIYALDHGHEDREAAIAKLRAAYEDLFKFKDAFTEAGRNLGMPTTMEEVKEYEEDEATRGTALAEFNVHRTAALETINKEFDSMLENYPANDMDTTDPEALQLNLLKDELRGFLIEFEATAIKYMEEIDTEERTDTKEKMEAMQGKFEGYVARVDQYSASLPSRTFLGFVQYRISNWGWEGFRGWVRARNKSILFVAFSLFVRAYKEGSWTDLANGITLTLNS